MRGEVSEPEVRPAQNVLAEALAAELGVDNSPVVLAGAEQILMRCWLDGYALLPVPAVNEDT